MQRIINHLVQLQELVLIREQEAFMGGERLKELDEAIKGLTDQLPDGVRGIFLRLQKRDSAVVAPVSHGTCSSCGMKLPTSLIQAVRAAGQIQHCPNCTRILYYTDSTARSLARKQKRTEPQRVGVARFSAEELMIPRLQAGDRDEALRELASKMESEGFVERADMLVEAALRREAIMSTAVGHGVALPHVRGVEGGGLTLAFGISPKGIQFGPSEKTPVHFIFLIVIPTAANAFYLKLLSGLTEVMGSADARAALMTEEDPKKLWRALKKLTRKSIP